MKSLLRSLSQLGPISIAILRVVMGVIFLYQGYNKVFKAGFAIEYFRNTFHIPVSEFFGPLVSVLELGGGALLIVGLFTRYLGILFTIEFIVAALIQASLKGPTKAMLEYVILVAVFVLATHGAGTLSLDKPGQRWEP